MDQAKPSEHATQPSGSERRAHVRHPVSVPVEIMIEGLGTRNAQARDFCLGGLLIVFDPDNHLPNDQSHDGSLCLITLKIDSDDFRLRARIVRAEQDCVGVAFINPDQIALQALQKHAEVDAQPVAQQQLKSPETKKATVNSEQLCKILNACNTKAKDFVTSLLDNFFTLVNEKLLEKAKIEDNISLQNLYFKALETINSNKNLAINSYSHSFDLALENNHILNNNNDNELQDEATLNSLELISDEEFNVWLANSKVINKVESEYPQLLSAIESRLSYLYDQPVDRRNNPYGPSLFVNSFQNVLELLELNNNAKPVCYDAFRLAMVSISKQFYTEINQFLIENNILPNLKDIIAHARKSVQQQTDESGEITEQKTHDKSETTVVAEEDEKPATPTPEKPNQIEAGNEFTQQSLYELVGEIRTLQQQLKQPITAGRSPAAEFLSPGNRPSNYTNNVVKLPSYSTEEVLDVISAIPIPHQTINGDGQSLTNFRQALNEHLDASDDENRKALSVQQGRIIDVTENVFTSLLNDLQVAHSIRPWLEQLAVPVMKMALLDDNIFTDKNHVVRNVINKLSELEVLASAEDQEEQKAVQQAFNWVINLVNNDFDGTTEVYTRAAQQLDLLIKVQQRSFEKNIQQVVAEALKEDHEQANSNDKPEESEDEKRDKWLRMARRLKENHWVLFDADSEDSKRLKVAWIAPRKGKYVFVNVMGRKDRIVTDAQLAEQFQAGTAVMLDGTDDPAMDRAQYGMLQKLHKQLLYQSSHDELTGLINRREFVICIQHALDDAKLSKNKHAICYLDIDDFKVVNTNYGYEAGDKLLAETINLISKNIKEHNVLSRIGSDQFGLLLQTTSMDDAVEIMEEIMEQLIDYRFEWQDNRISITISVGIAIINANTEDTTNLLQTAESSCSIAKDSGGNQIQIAHAGSSRFTRRQKEMEWATKIDKAIDENGLFLRCQKIIPVQPHLDQRPHYEILLGISDELGGNKSLADFIQAAEQHNRMAAIDRWVIQNAFQWLSQYEDLVTDVSAFSVNLSGQSLNNEQLIEFIYQQVNQTSVSIEKICFEVTETAGVTNLSDTADFIETIKGTGCNFSLDDFGTGMSSYSYLKSLPVDYLKIDGTFIKDIANNQNDYAVVKSICEIGHFMEKKVIAEFVQDEKSAAILKDIGVDYLQGYGIEKPHRIDALIQ